MRRFLLLFLILFSLRYSHSQVILNELYTSPKPGLSEFFELYNTNTGTPVNLDCYAMIVFWDDGIGNQGFYVLDFPNLSIGPLSFFVGAATGPSFDVQQCSQVAPNFNWKLVNGTNDASLKNYVKTGTTYTEAPSFPDLDDFFTWNKNSQTSGDKIGGFNYALFLFDNGNYVNGFMGGHNSILVPPSVTTMPALTYSTNCGPKTIDWSTITKAENVTENTGADRNSDNGFMRERDGKCGEWVKASSPTRDQFGNCTDDNHEHTPGQSNNGRSPVNDGFSLTTQTSVCGTRIDYAITGIRDRGNLKAPDMFPFVVELYEDRNTNGELDAGDLYITTSPQITAASATYYEFSNLSLDPNKKYLLVFQSVSLNCLEKIVATESVSVATTEANFCGSEIDFTVTNSNFSIGANSGFTASIYEDKGIIGQYEEALDLPFTNPSMTPYQFTDVKLGETLTFDIPTEHEGKPYIIVYSSVRSSVICNASTKSGLTPVTTTISTPAQIYTCGDLFSGNPLTFRVPGISGNTVGATPLSVEVWLDYNGNGSIETTGSNPDILYETINDVALATTYQTFVFEDSEIPLVLRYITGRGCNLTLAAVPECTPLPVNFGSFTAIRNRNRVALKWETFTEQNNRGFYVQRNTKGVWENRAFVFSAANGGNSNDPLAYTFNDDNNEKGVSQYRIQQVDLDGKATFTPIRSVKGLEQIQRTIVYPNPSENGKVNVVFEEQGAKNITVSDISGRIVRQYRSVVNNLVVDNLDPGVYIFQIIDLSTTEASVEKVIIKKR
jgi:hypothetical protein